MSDISVSAARAADIDAFVASVDGLFHEDGGRHDPFRRSARGAALDAGRAARRGAPAAQAAVHRRS